MTSAEGLADPVVLRRVVPHPRARVFDAWLDPGSLARWMRPRAESTATAEVDARVGGKFRIVMRHGSDAIEHTGEYLIIERPSRLSFTWVSVNTHGRPTIVTVDFIEHQSGTEIVLTHQGLPPEKRDAHRKGWGEILRKLEEAHDAPR